jgi:tyrosyl-DNA phosphodiesterase-1
VYQTTSIGNVTPEWIKEMLSSISPGSFSLEELKPKKGLQKSKTAGAGDLFNDVTEQLNIIYPTKDYIMNESPGPEFGGCLLLSSQNHEKTTFPKRSFCKYEGRDDYSFFQGVIPHLKVMILCNPDYSIDDDTLIYFGSHNLSPAAWGKYEKDCSQINIYNTELGVLMPPMKGMQAFW